MIKLTDIEAYPCLINIDSIECVFTEIFKEKPETKVVLKGAKGRYIFVTQSVEEIERLL